VSRTEKLHQGHRQLSGPIILLPSESALSCQSWDKEERCGMFKAYERDWVGLGFVVDACMQMLETRRPLDSCPRAPLSTANSRNTIRRRGILRLTRGAEVTKLGLGRGSSQLSVGKREVVRPASTDLDNSNFSTPQNILAMMAKSQDKRALSLSVPALNSNNNNNIWPSTTLSADRLDLGTPFAAPTHFLPYLVDGH